MAKRIIKEIDCPHCKERSEIEMWDSINASLNTGLKDKVKDGSIFDWTCPHCGKTSRVMYPFLYIDMLHTFLVWFGAPDACDPALYQTMTLDGYEFRNARTFNELIEKINLLENGIDDHALEVLKFSIVQALYKQTEGGTKAPLPAMILFREEEEDAFLLSVLYQNAPARMMKAAKKTYNAIKNDIASNPTIQKGLKENAGKFQTVDAAWAKNAIIAIGAQKRGK